MKKLISVFAALALVGSLAAQKKPAKPAAPAAPAAPAVKAPAAPAVTAPVAAPAPAASGKGMGLFVEGRGSYTLAHGTSSAQPTGDASAATVDYKLANSSGFGGGATIGYELVKNLGIVASFDYRSIKTRKWENQNQDAGLFSSALAGNATSNNTIQRTTETMVLGLGFRPSVEALGGTVYAGLGFAYVLPFKDVTEISATNFAGAAATSVPKAVTKTENWNAAMGVYAELGYNYHITDMLYVGLGVRALVATANNDGKSTESKSTSQAGTETTTTVNYAASDTASTSPYSSNGVTDMSVTVSLGARF